MHLLKRFKSNDTPAPQPKSPTVQFLMSSKLFAAVKSIREAKCGEVATSHYKLTVLKPEETNYMTFIVLQ